MWRRAEVGLVDPFGAKKIIFQTKHHECNEGESEEPTGKDSNESVYGRSGSSVVVLGLARAAPEQRRRSSPVQRHRGAASPEQKHRGAYGRHQPVPHGQTLFLLTTISFFSAEC